MKIREALSTAVVVLLMSLVVWVIADRNVLRYSPELTASVEVSSPDPLYRLNVVDPPGSDPQIQVRFRGPGRAIDSLTARHHESPLKYRHTVRRQQLSGDSGDIILPVRQGFSYLADEESVSLDYARTPGDQRPMENLIVHYEREEKLAEIPVELSEEDRRQLGDNPVIVPPKVSAVVLASQRDQLQRGAPLKAVPQLDLRDIPAGRQVTRTVPLRSNQPEGIQVSFIPPRVTVTLQLTSQEKEGQLRDVKIVVEAPPDLLNRYEVKLTESRISVLKVKGPVAEVEALEPADVTAALVLTQSDKPGTLVPRQLEIRFPRDSLIRLDEPPPMANFELRERSAPPE